MVNNSWFRFDRLLFMVHGVLFPAPSALCPVHIRAETQLFPPSRAN